MGVLLYWSISEMTMFVCNCQPQKCIIELFRNEKRNTTTCPENHKMTMLNIIHSKSLFFVYLSSFGNLEKGNEAVSTLEVYGHR